MANERIVEAGLTELLHGLSALPALLEALREHQRQLAQLRSELADAKSGHPEPSDGWLDAKAAARYLGVSDNTFDKYRYKTTPRLKGYPLDGKVLYKRSDLDSFVRLYAIRSAGQA